jgi:hypothetical protein
LVGTRQIEEVPIVSVFIEPTSPSATQVRLSFVMGKTTSTTYGSGHQDGEPIYDPAVYQTAFEQINKTVFIRKGMSAPAATAASPAAPIAIVPASAQTK